ncbi:MAG: hypothetical protein AAFQ98_14370 [Bacteroidota bacterium]
MEPTHLEHYKKVLLELLEDSGYDKREIAIRAGLSYSSVQRFFNQGKGGDSVLAHLVGFAEDPEGFSPPSDAQGMKDILRKFRYAHPTPAAQVLNTSSLPMIEGCYNAFGMEASSHGPEHVRFYIANYEFLGDRMVFRYVLDSGEIIEAQILVRRTGHHLLFEADLPSLKLMGMAYVGASAEVEKFTLTCTTSFGHQPLQCVSNMVVCERVEDNTELVGPVRNLTHFHEDSLDYLINTGRTLSQQVLHKLKHAEFEVRYTGQPLISSFEVQHFSVGIWEGDANDVEVPEMSCEYDPDQILEYTLTFSVGFINDLMHFDGYSSVENTVDDWDEAGNIVKRQQIITWRLIAEARIHKDHIAATYVAYEPDKPLSPPDFFVAAALLKMDQHKKEANGVFQFQRLIEDDKTAEGLLELAVGRCRVHKLREGVHTMDDVLQRHCTKLQNRFPDYSEERFYHEYKDRGY